jgi:hypothetical protein
LTTFEVNNILFSFLIFVEKTTKIIRTQQIYLGQIMKIIKTTSGKQTFKYTVAATTSK